jgi:hypothetical protein
MMVNCEYRITYWCNQYNFIIGIFPKNHIRFSSVGWFMPRHHTWEGTRNYIFCWAWNCFKRSLLSIKINDSHIMHEAVDTPLARIGRANSFANMVIITPMFLIQRLSISKWLSKEIRMSCHLMLSVRLLELL